MYGQVMQTMMEQQRLMIWPLLDSILSIKTDTVWRCHPAVAKLLLKHWQSLFVGKKGMIVKKVPIPYSFSLYGCQEAMKVENKEVSVEGLLQISWPMHRSKCNSRLFLFLFAGFLFSRRHFLAFLQHQGIQYVFLKKNYQTVRKVKLKCYNLCPCT